MEERKHTSNGVPTFDMIPMLMANLLEDNKILSAKLDAINRKISASVGNSKVDDQRMDVTEAQKYIPWSSSCSNHLWLDLQQHDTLS